MQTDRQDQWIATSLGQHLLEQEQQIYDVAVADLFGFHAVQIGLTQINCLKDSRISNVFFAGNNQGHLLCESSFLPFAENSIDLLCLPHALEFSDNPHQTLREGSRVLVPEGHLILTVFNPFSAWGVRKFFTKKNYYPYCGNFFSISRIKDWLALLDLEVVEAQFFSYELPISNEKWYQRFSFIGKIGDRWWPAMGGQYIIIAKKRVVNVNLLKPKWKHSLLQSGLAIGGRKKRDAQRVMKKEQNREI